MAKFQDVDLKSAAGLTGEEGRTPGRPTPDRQSTSNTKYLDVLVIGAGFAGICMGVKLLEAGIRDFVIIEKEKDVGGTWYKNTYPGATCDVPSHFYSFSFAPNPDWSHVYSRQSEIQAYIRRCAEEYGLIPYIRFGCEISDIRFDEETAFWTLNLPDGQRYAAHHLVLGSGGLNTPKVPDFRGLEDFSGPVFHTARWRQDVECEGKKIAVIGSAASAVQVVPKLAKIADKVMMFQRTPNYIAPRLDRAYTEVEKARFRHSPWRRVLLRWQQFMRYELIVTPLFRRKSRLRARVARQINSHMLRVIKDAELRKKLLPDYELGCKRILISDDFFPSLNRENVVVITEGISHMDKTGIVDSEGIHHEADIIVMATGFDLKKQMISINLLGPEGRSLAEEWADLPAAYQGCMVPGFPNAYFVTGPNTGVGSTSVVYMIEAQVAYIMKCLDLAGREKLVAPTEAAGRDYNRKLQEDMSETVWSTGCSSWYKDEKGRVGTLYPRPGRIFKREKRRLKLQDFNIQQKTAGQLEAAREAGV